MATPDTSTRRDLVKQGKAMPERKSGGTSGGRFPIRNRDDLPKAIRAVGRAAGGEAGRAAVRRHIIKRARALGLSNLIPANWAADGSLKSS